MHSDQHTTWLVDDYLARLRAAGDRLPAGRRDELVAEVRDHIEAALGTDAARTEADVRNALDRLGPPEDIVAAEGVEAIPAPGPPRAWGPLEIVAVLLVAVGGFLIPIVGTLAGIVLVWVSPRWTSRQKAIGTAIACLPVLLLGLGFTLSTPSRPG